MNADLVAQAPVADEEAGFVSELFIRFESRYLRRWPTMRDEESEMVRIYEWARGLRALSADDIERGMARLSERPAHKVDWPPSVDEFRELCLPNHADLGLPEPEDAYRQAIRSDWSHPAVHWAAQQCWHQLMFQGAREARPAFSKAYRQALDMARGGHVFEEPAWMKVERALVNQRDEPLSAEENKKRVPSLRAALRGEYPGGGA
ncbi:hypothetical protein V5738_11020 [Salinisphaera sp. SPP-AMP-43]|uniref:hypothetical protein n=1 Tax=Salinisphaera sp. SPP-AMP-43 TaxID=3121288 RepID=UPI003C6DBEE3